MKATTNKTDKQNHDEIQCKLSKIRQQLREVQLLYSTKNKVCKKCKHTLTNGCGIMGRNGTNHVTTRKYTCKCKKKKRNKTASRTIKKKKRKKKSRKSRISYKLIEQNNPIKQSTYLNDQSTTRRKKSYKDVLQM